MAPVPPPPCPACFGKGTITPIDLRGPLVTCSRCKGLTVEPPHMEPIHAWSSGPSMKCGRAISAVSEKTGGVPSWRIVDGAQPLTYADGITCLMCIHYPRPRPEENAVAYHSPIRDRVTLDSAQAEAVRDLLFAVQAALAALETGAEMTLATARLVTAMEGEMNATIGALRDHVATADLIPSNAKGR